MIILKMLAGMVWGYGSSYFIVSQMGVSGLSIATALIVAVLGGLAIGFVPVGRNYY